MQSATRSSPLLTLPPVFLRRPTNEASLSRHLAADTPSLVHTLRQEDNSILSIATDENHIYSGSQNQNISVTPPFVWISTPAHADPILQVWDIRTYTLKTELRGHTGSVLALEYAPDKRWLFSSSGMFPGSFRLCRRINQSWLLQVTARSGSVIILFILPGPSYRQLVSLRSGRLMSSPRSTSSTLTSTPTPVTSSPSHGRPLTPPSISDVKTHPFNGITLPTSATRYRLVHPLQDLYISSSIATLKHNDASPIFKLSIKLSASPETQMDTPLRLSLPLRARSSMSLRGMLLTRLITAMSTAWHFCHLPVGVRPLQSVKTSFLLLGAAMRL